MPDDRNDPTQPSTTAVMLNSLYNHACEHQELLLALSKSLSAMRSVLVETIDGFDDKYNVRLESEKDDEFFQLFNDQLQAMKGTLHLIRENLANQDPAA